MTSRIRPRHTDAIDDTGDGYTIRLRDRWEVQCLWCDWESGGHRLMRHAIAAYKVHEEAALKAEAQR